MGWICGTCLHFGRRSEVPCTAKFSLSLEDLGLVSVSVSFMVVCINTLLNMGVFKTLFIINGSILLFVLMKDGRLPPEIVYGVKHFGHLFISNLMNWIGRRRRFQNDGPPTNYNQMNDGEHEHTHLKSEEISFIDLSPNTSSNSVKKTTKDKDVECTMEELIDNGLVPNAEAARITLRLISEGFSKTESIKAANECSCLEFARMYLQKSCNMCSKVSPVSEVIPMMMCAHSFCKKCFKHHFETVIDSDYLDLSCPICFLPDVDSDQDIVHCHYTIIQTALENMLDEAASRKFQNMMVINAI